ncbi:pentatricopeptide repeat-containing protein At5g61400-like [Gossypium hirsutum]|uniref:Pentatricopeptide repeat-containing protein At5g61400-like n=1 Tax=Gossypium hirsutum TaxID=3635 RepID=A0ABM2YXB9_GOSHI|nr:pentatricopeptide repeat-containing protein At5g61400-like [Gossypium hirsutum]
MIQDIADDDQAERILAIPISKPKPLDTMVWRHEGTCVYTIKSGNKLLLREKLQMLGAYSTHLTKAIAMFHIEMLVHEGIRKTVNELLGFMSGYLQETDALEFAKSINFSPEQTFWKPLDLGFINLNFDASYNVVLKTSISRILVRDEMGQIMVLEANVAAHVLAKEGHRFSEERYWVEEAPEVVERTTAVEWSNWMSKIGFDSMWDLYKELLSRGFWPNVVTYGVLIKKMDRVERALEINRMMISDRLGPNIVTFGILIDGLCKVGELMVARRYFVCRVKYGVFPNIFVYNCLIDGYCRAGNVSEVVELSLEIEKLEILPDVITYSILIKGLCTAGKVEEESFFLQKMNKDGVLANSVTYNSLIDGYCKVGNMEKALEICSQMNKNGVEPNVITFSTLIDGYCNTGNMEATVGFYSEMVIKSLVLDVVAFTALINGYCKNGNIKKAFRLQKEMLESGLMPNVFTLSSLIDGLCKDGRV